MRNEAFLFYAEHFFKNGFHIIMLNMIYILWQKYCSQKSYNKKKKYKKVLTTITTTKTSICAVSENGKNEIMIL